MNALERVRRKFGPLTRVTDKAAKRASVGSVGASLKECLKLFPMTTELERRLRAMAGRWDYTDGQLAELLIRSRAGPEGWLGGVIRDEQREQEIRERTLRRADA